MLGHMVEKVEEKDIFRRERTPTAVRVYGALTSHAGASYRKAAALFGVSHEAVRQWYIQLEPLFQPPRRVGRLSPSTRRRATLTAGSSTAGRPSTSRPSRSFTWTSHPVDRVSTRCCFSGQSWNGAGANRSCSLIAPVVRLAAGDARVPLSERDAGHPKPN